jgi:hypothetical protein
MSWAIDSVADKRKPAAKKGTVKDCHILGQALLLSTLLAAAGYPNSRVLVSSNRSDFADPNATVFHPEVVPHAAPAGLRYAVSPEAVADLRAIGEIP